MDYLRNHGLLAIVQHSCEYCPELIYEFYANTKPSFCVDYEIWVRGHKFFFGPEEINAFFGLEGAAEDAPYDRHTMACILSAGSIKLWGENEFQHVYLCRKVAGIYAISKNNWLPIKHTGVIPRVGHSSAILLRTTELILGRLFLKRCANFWTISPNRIQQTRDCHILV